MPIHMHTTMRMQCYICTCAHCMCKGESHIFAQRGREERRAHTACMHACAIHIPTCVCTGASSAISIDSSGHGRPWWLGVLVASSLGSCVASFTTQATATLTVRTTGYLTVDLTVRTIACVMARTPAWGVMARTTAWAMPRLQARGLRCSLFGARPWCSRSPFGARWCRACGAGLARAPWNMWWKLDSTGSGGRRPTQSKDVIVGERCVRDCPGWVISIMYRRVSLSCRAMHGSDSLLP